MTKPLRRARLAVLAALAGAGAARAGEPGFAFATLDNGASIGFALIRSGQPAPSGEAAAGAIGDVVFTRSSSVSRVLWDRDSGAYFGYRVQVDRLKGNAFRLTVRALDPAAVEEPLRRLAACPGCPTPAPLPAASARYPAPQRLGEGEVLTLELLGNPTTGERILDVVKVSARPLSPEAMRAAAARAREAWEAVERANLHVSRGHHEAALAEYLKALALQPQDAALHNKLGMSYQYLGRHDMARAEYNRALALNPDYAEVWNNVGTLEQAQNNMRPAVRAYRKASRCGLRSRRRGRTWATPTWPWASWSRPTRPTARPSASIPRSWRRRHRPCAPRAWARRPTTSTSRRCWPPTASSTPPSSSWAGPRTRASPTSPGSPPTPTSPPW
jgi:hypothetical protein